jgi:hypothetical protein
MGHKTTIYHLTAPVVGSAVGAAVSVGVEFNAAIWVIS